MLLLAGSALYDPREVKRRLSDLAYGGDGVDGAVDDTSGTPRRREARVQGRRKLFGLEMAILDGKVGLS